MVASFNTAMAWGLPLGNVLLEEIPEEEIEKLQVRREMCSFYLNFAVEEMLPKLFVEPCRDTISNVWTNIILLESLFLIIEALTLLKLLKQRNFLLHLAGTIREFADKRKNLDHSHLLHCFISTKTTRVSSSLIGCPIYSALCHIKAKNFINYYLDGFLGGTSGGVMVSKLEQQTYTSEFESRWVPCATSKQRTS